MEAEAEVEAQVEGTTDDDGDVAGLPVPDDDAAQLHREEAVGAEAAAAEVEVAGEDAGEVSGVEDGRATPEVGALVEELVEELAAEL